MAKSLGDRLPRWEPKRTIEFLCSEEQAEFKSIITQMFNISTDFPLQFVDSFIPELERATRALCPECSKGQSTEGKAKASEPLKCCFERILNKDTLSVLNGFIAKLTGKKITYESIDDCVAQLQKQFYKFAENSNYQLSNLCAFMYYDYMQKDSDYTVETKKKEARHLAVPYNKQIYLTHAQNEIVKQLYNILEPYSYFEIEEQKQDWDSEQPLLTIMEVMDRVEMYTDYLEYTQEGLLNRLEQYEHNLDCRVAKWFYSTQKEKDYNFE